MARLRITFVLPKNCKDESEISDIMLHAYEVSPISIDFPLFMLMCTILSLAREMCKISLGSKSLMLKAQTLQNVILLYSKTSKVAPLNLQSKASVRKFQISKSEVTTLKDTL